MILSFIVLYNIPYKINCRAYSTLHGADAAVWCVQRKQRSWEHCGLRRMCRWVFVFSISEFLWQEGLLPKAIPFNFIPWLWLKSLFGILLVSQSQNHVEIVTRVHYILYEWKKDQESEYLLHEWNGEAKGFWLQRSWGLRLRLKAKPSSNAKHFSSLGQVHR